MRYRQPGMSVAVTGGSQVLVGAQYGSNGPSRDKSGIGGTFDEVGPGHSEIGVDTGRYPRPYQLSISRISLPANQWKCKLRQVGSVIQDRNVAGRRLSKDPGSSSVGVSKPGKSNAEASPAKSLGGILAHPKPVQVWAGLVRISRYRAGTRPSSQKNAPK